MKKFSNILWGVILIAIGIIWGLNATGIAQINIFFEGWWTLFLIIPSIIGIIEKPKDSSGYIFLAIGVILLLGARDLISFEIIGKLIFPIILVLIGAGIIFKDTINGEVSKQIAKIDKNGTEIYTSTFSDNKIKLSGDEFKNVKIDATFGSITLDLSECNIQTDGVITASAIFASIDIIVPKDVKVKVKSTGIFGATDNKIKNTNVEGAKTIYVESLALFGGVDIK